MRFHRLALAAIAALLPAMAFAHGGGGGAVYVPVYIGGGGVMQVPGAKTGDYSQIHTIAIVSALGQKLMIGNPGLIMKHEAVDVSDWNLDDDVAATLRRYLAPRFKFAEVSYDRAKLATIDNDSNSNSTQALHDYLAALPAQGVDAFVVVRPDAEHATPLESGLWLSLFGNSAPVVVADYELDVIDARSLQVIGHAFSRIQTRQGGPIAFVRFETARDLAIDPDQPPTAPQRANLKIWFDDVVKRSLVDTLRALNLGIALPGAGTRALVRIPDDKWPFAKIKNVAIVSALGDDVALDHRGAWFVHDTDTIPSTGIDLDARIEALVAQSLDKRFTVKPAAGADRAKIAKFDLPYTQAALATPIDGLTRTAISTHTSSCSSTRAP
ncbi:MAG TPA: hypothetical protein VGF56_12320 [Rhizomicrobium sp.]|jgi:hypothetical protein